MTDEKTTQEKILYELGFHLDPAISEDKISSKIDGIKKVLTDNGSEIVKEGQAKSMKLAYEITKPISGKNIRFNTSTFSWIKFNSTSDKINLIKEGIDEDDEIIRSLIVKTTDDEEHSTSKIANEDEEDEIEVKESEEEKLDDSDEEDSGEKGKDDEETEEEK